VRVLFACAGTGGHIIPAVVLARELRKRDENIDILFCLADDKRGTQILEKEGMAWITVPVRPFPRYINARSFLFPFSIVRGIGHSLSVVNQYKPQVVVGTGGYVSGPVLLAARMHGIPVIVQEQNNTLGLANRLLAPFVNEIHVSFPEAANVPWVSPRKVFLTGNPIAFGNNGERDSTVTSRESPGNPPVILVMGGSQGARSINRVMVRYLRSYDTVPYSFYVQTGENDYEWVCESLKGRIQNMVVSPFFDNLPAIYNETDLVVCRAGAMTLSEIAFWGIPSILIPYPYATGGHQERNARQFVKTGAALVIDEQKFDWQALKGSVEKVLGSMEDWLRMSRAAYALRRPDARDVLVNRIIALGR
jgi:UDP-N-acetylglucosamine--N-acetylmuramyl-(pentapeptide) pyrophosphoryl-undecaprenol N-acetylglucosamine transferase